MATTKTLTPTNQAITLAAFTEKPDNRTNVTNDDKLADAVNALNSNMTVVTVEAASEHTYQNRKVVFTKAGHAAMFRLDGLVNIATASNTICSTPTGFAPAGTFAHDIWIGSNNAKLRFSLNASEVAVYNYSGSTISDSNINIVIQYICA